MRPSLRHLARQQHGLVTRAQCLLAGYTERELRTLTRPGGEWVVVRRGAYVERVRWVGLDEVQRLVLHDRAAHLALGNTALLSHDSAARSWGLAMLRPELRMSHVTRYGVWGCRTDHGVKHHLTRRPVSAVAFGDVPVTGLERTAVDLGREHGSTAGVVACDAALRLGGSVEGLDRAVGAMRSWPYVTQARAAVDLARVGAESPGESLGRLLVSELGAGEPETQFPVRLAGGRTVWADLRLERLLIEFDGRIKYVGRDAGGVAEAPAEEVAWNERRREVLVEAEGFVCSRLIWSDLWGHPREAARQRLARDLARARASYGGELTPEQARVAETRTGVRAQRLKRAWRADVAG